MNHQSHRLAHVAGQQLRRAVAGVDPMRVFHQPITQAVTGRQPNRQQYEWQPGCFSHGLQSRSMWVAMQI
jgi:hypothetical protein